MSLKELGEGIILQAIEDLYCDEVRGASIALFESEDLQILAEIAGMGVASQAVLINLVRHIIAGTCVTSDKRWTITRRKEMFST
jgi:hypothetical protein